MLKSDKAGFFKKTPTGAMIKHVKIARNRGFFLIYVKTLLCFFLNFYILIEGFEDHILSYMQEKYFWKYSPDCSVCHLGRVPGP